MTGSSPLGADGTGEVGLGDLTYLVDGPDLRYVRWKGIEIVRRIYVTVRDEDWDTPDLDLRRIALDEPAAGRARMSALAAHRSDTVDVTWRATSEGRDDGAVAYEVGFTPARPFAYSRMGLCVLFPPSALIGSRYEAWAGNAHVEGRFEAPIAPQIIEGDEILPLFQAFDRLHVDIVGVGRLELSMGGDLLEMEDQRNWSDGSFKAYCTPLSVRRPQHAAPSSPVAQRVEIRVVPRGPARPQRARPAEPDQVRVTLGAVTGTTLPHVGTVVRDTMVDEPGFASLGSLGLEHIRVDLRGPGDRAARLTAAAAAADRIGAQLAPALFLAGEDAELQAVAGALAGLDRPPARILVFPRDAPCERGALTARLREALGDRLESVPIVGGTDVWFVDLNRARPAPDSMDGVAWSITPGVHAYDDLTLVEGLEAQGDQVRTARGFAPGLQLVVGPVTLRPRYNPNARDAREQALTPTPASTDPRQAEMLAAAWTVGSLRSLGEAGVTAVTYFEATGPRGLMSPDGSSAFPVWHVLATAGAWTGAPIFSAESEQPLAVQSLAVGEPGGDRVTALLVANQSDRLQRVRLGPLPWTTARVRALASPSGRPAGRPFEHVEELERPVREGQLDLELTAHAVARVAVSGHGKMV